MTTRSQISITLLFFTLFLIVGHLGIWFVLFPADPDARLLGFPVHYALALLAGWPVLLVLVAVYARIANRLDDRIGGDADLDAGPDGSSRAGPEASSHAEPDAGPNAVTAAPVDD